MKLIFTLSEILEINSNIRVNKTLYIDDIPASGHSKAQRENIFSKFDLSFKASEENNITFVFGFDPYNKISSVLPKLSIVHV